MGGIYVDNQGSHPRQSHLADSGLKHHKILQKGGDDPVELAAVGQGEEDWDRNHSIALLPKHCLISTYLEMEMHITTFALTSKKNLSSNL